MTKPLDLVDTKDIANMLGVTRAHATNRIVTRPDFPKPAVNLSQRLRKWRRDDVLKLLLGKGAQIDAATSAAVSR